MKPLAPERFELRATIDQETRELLQHAQNLLGHRVQAGDVANVLKLALKALVEQLEKNKFGAGSVPRKIGDSNDSSHIPAHVKRAVWKRDGGQCTFRGAGGHRCEARRDLEFDHIHPVARGGDHSIGNVRLLCRAHNQLEAERAYGSGFMEAKKRVAIEAREAAKSRAVNAGATAAVMNGAC